MPDVVDIVDDISSIVNGYHDGRNGWFGIEYSDGVLTIEFESAGDNSDTPEGEDAWPSFTKKFKLIEEN